MESVSDIVDALGGPGEFGKACGFTANPSQRGSDMRRRGSIPVHYWPGVISAARAKGIELDEASLTKLHQGKAPAAAGAES